MAIKTMLECDMVDCYSKLELDGPYHIAKEEMKENGWRNRKIDDEWQIICNNHKESRF